jgi:hypothetical protein
MKPALAARFLLIGLGLLAVVSLPAQLTQTGEFVSVFETQRYNVVSSAPPRS